MPDPVIWDGQRFPASYANFYIANTVVIVPTFRCRLRFYRDRLGIGKFSLPEPAGASSLIARNHSGNPFFGDLLENLLKGNRYLAPFYNVRKW